MKQVMHNLYKNSTDNNDERYLDIYVVNNIHNFKKYK